MTNTELILSMLAEVSAKDISEVVNPKTFDESKVVAKQGGTVARKARLELEARTAKKVVSSLNARDTLQLMQGAKKKSKKKK